MFVWQSVENLAEIIGGMCAYVEKQTVLMRARFV